MSRIIAGRLGGRRLTTPKGRATRPTSDRVREALFSQLEHEIDMHGARVLDVYAGSGALALEALSRGASVAMCVESDRTAVGLIRSNADDLGVAGEVSVRAERAETCLAKPADHRFDVALLDPPYDVDEATLGAVLTALMEQDWLTGGAVVVVERASRSPEPTWPPGLTRFASRRYGETTLWWAEMETDDDVA